MLRSTLLYLSERETPRKLISRLSSGKRLASRFIAGENLDEALDVVRRLNHDGFDVTLDLLGESVSNRVAAEQASHAYTAILDRIATEGLRSNISIKLTQLGLEIGPEVAHQNLNPIWQAAASRHTFVRIDMEGSAYTQSTLRVFYEAGAPRESLGVVIQSYLYRSEKDVDDLLKHGAQIRLVKGAYNEPPELAFPRKQDVDENFALLMKKLLSSGNYHAIASHDPAMIEATKAFARESRLKQDSFEFQMLYGIRRDLQNQLKNEGYRVRIYVPYGGQWYAYFMRRLAERPANLIFLLKNLGRS
ncbi:MAG: proline dehydrogenase family protein [Terriglobia bacterium]